MIRFAAGFQRVRSARQKIELLEKPRPTGPCGMVSELQSCGAKPPCICAHFWQFREFHRCEVKVRSE